MKKTNFRRRGERLLRLAYELELLGAAAKTDGISDGLSGHRGSAAGICRAIGEAYLAKAKGE